MHSIPDIPTLKIPAVFHFGHLDPEKKRRNSQEAHCLSVSLHPISWRQIAKLGGLPLQLLVKDEAVFADMAECYQRADIRFFVQQWSLATGLCTEKRIIRAWEYDDETEAWWFCEHLNLDAAMSECMNEEDVGYGNPQSIDEPCHAMYFEEVSALTGTKKLESITGVSDLAARDAYDFLLLVWLDAHKPEIDGAWWVDVLDPAGLTAPRGGIFPSRLPGWAVETLPVDRVKCDEAALALVEDRFSTVTLNLTVSITEDGPSL